MARTPAKKLQKDSDNPGARVVSEVPSNSQGAQNIGTDIRGFNKTKKCAVLKSDRVFVMKPILLFALLSQYAYAKQQSNHVANVSN